MPAYYCVSSLAGYSWTERKWSLELLLHSGLLWAYPLYRFWPVLGITMIDFVLRENSAYFFVPMPMVY